MSNVISLGKNSGSIEPAELLEQIRETIVSGKIKGKRALVVILDCEDGGYAVETRQCGMRASEVIALLENAKTLWQREMGLLS